MTSALFAPLKPHGSVATGPIAVHTQGNGSMIAAAVNNSFIVYSTDRLHILYQGPPLSGPISHMIWVKRCLVFSIASDIHCWTPGQDTAPLVGSHSSPVVSLCSLTSHFLSYSTDGSLLLFEHFTSFCPDTSLRTYSFNLVKNHTTITGGKTLLHPSTLVNKVLIGGDEGLHLINFKTGKTLFCFNSLLSQVKVKATALAQSPAAGVIAITFTTEKLDQNLEEKDLDFDLDSEIFGPQLAILNILFGEVLLRCELPDVSPSILFRTDGPQLCHVMTAKHQLVTVSLTQRNASITRIIGLPKSFLSTHRHFDWSNSIVDLPGHPMMIFAAFEFLSVVVFETESGSNHDNQSINCRVLRHRFGLDYEPSVLLPLMENDTNAGTRIVCFGKGLPFELSTILSHQSRHWQSKSTVDLPTCIGAAQGLSTANKWPSVCSVHSGENLVRIWDAKNGTESESIKFDCEVVAVDVSYRSEFVAVVLSKSRGSIIEVYRLESRLKSWSMEIPDCQVLSLHFDIFNRKLTCCTIDGKIIIIDIFGRKVKTMINLESSIVASSILVKQSLVAVVSINNCLSIIDLIREVEVRRFQLPSRSPIAQHCLTFDTEGRTVYSANILGQIFAYDVTSNVLVDKFTCSTRSGPASIKALTFLESLSLFSTHPGKNSVFEWYSREKYEVISRKSVLNNDFYVVNLPGEAQSKMISSQSSTVKNDISLVEVLSSFKLLSESNSFNLMRLSRENSRLWKELPVFDLIKSRNRPSQSATTPSAPFFLDFVKKESVSTEKSSKVNRAVDLSKRSSILGRMMTSSAVDTINFLLKQTPSGAFSLISELISPINEQDITENELVLFIKILVEIFEGKFEVVELTVDHVEAWLACFLKIFGMELKSNHSDLLGQLMEVRNHVISTVDESILTAQCALEFYLDLISV
ncbi:hypothetical protein RCL1_006254 [Eukaryota sp. TZLM3-RCL]